MARCDPVYFTYKVVLQNCLCASKSYVTVFARLAAIFSDPNNFDTHALRDHKENDKGKTRERLLVAKQHQVVHQHICICIWRIIYDYIGRRHRYIYICIYVSFRSYVKFLYDLYSHWQYNSGMFLWGLSGFLEKRQCRRRITILKPLWKIFCNLWKPYVVECYIFTTVLRTFMHELLIVTYTVIGFKIFIFCSSLPEKA